MCCPVWDGCIKESLLLIGTRAHIVMTVSFLFTMCLKPYNCKYIVLSVLLNKTTPSFLLLETVFIYLMMC